MPKKMNNKKKTNNYTKNKKHESSSEDASESYDTEVTCDSQSETVNSASDDMTSSASDDGTVSSEATSSASDDATVGDDGSNTSYDSQTASENDISESEEQVYTKPKKTIPVKSKKTVPVKSKKTVPVKSKKTVPVKKSKKSVPVKSKKNFRVKSKGPLQNAIKIDKKKNGTDIRELCVTDINEQYSTAKYDDFSVIMMKKNGYINATKLCQEVAKQMGSKKKLKDFFGTNHNKEIVESVSLYTGIDVDDLKFLVQGGMKETKGTYVHHLLITHIASWASPKFAVKVSVIVNEYLSMKEKEKNDSLLKSKDDKINKLFILNKQSDAKLDELIRINKKQDEKLKENNITMDELLITNKNQETKIDGIKKNLKHALKTRDIVSDDLDKKCHHVVVKTGELKDDNILIIMKKNSPDDESDDDDINYKYYVARTNKENREATIARQKKSHENLTILMEIKYVPNSIMLWKNVCNDIAKGKKNKITVSRNDFNLSDNYTEQEFIKDIKNIFNKRLNRVNIVD